jgi:hypothetical protein
MFIPMRKPSFLFVSVLALASYAAASTDAKKIMEELNRDSNKAMLSKDFGYFDRTATPDFTSTQNGHTQNRKQSLAGIQQMFAMVKTITKVHSTVTSATMNGKTITATTESEMTAKVAAAKGKLITVVDRSIDKEVWVMTPSGWKIKSVITLSDKMTANGKPFNPGG